MGNNYETKHVFLAIAIGFFVIAPILLIFIPTVVAQSLYQTEGVWIVKLPKGTFWVYGIACFLVSMSGFIIAILDVRKLSIFLSIVFLLSSIPVFMFASQAYETIGNEGISYKKAFSFEEKHFVWEDVEHVIRHMGNNEEEYYGYEIEFKDGSIFMINDDKFLTSIRYMLTRTLQSKDIEVDIR